MHDLIVLLIHLITTVLRLARPGGVRAVVAESVLAKHQLLILNCSRLRAPNLRILDRLIAGFCSLWIKPRRFFRVAIAFKPSTLLNFHRVLVHRKYRPIVMVHPTSKRLANVCLADRNHKIQTFAPSTSNPALADRIPLGCLARSLQYG